MKVVVFGATGKKGREIVGQALENGHEVTAFVRDPSKLRFRNKAISAEDRLRVVSGDVAHAIVKEIDENAFVRMAVIITN